MRTSSSRAPRACGERGGGGARSNSLACGERAQGLHCPYRVRGSSTRVRGTLLTLAEQAPSYRFIPARAGNAQTRRSSRVAVSVHPRACGERRRHRVLLSRGTGSSPRVRGTHDMIGG